MTANQGISSKDSHFLSKTPPTSMKVTHLEDPGFTGLLSMFSERKVTIKPHTKVFDSVSRMEKTSKNIDRKLRGEFLTLSLGTKTNKFSFIRV